MLQICTYGDPVLRKKGAPVTVFDATLKALVENMIETMMVADGVGLAAPQVGQSLQLAVIDVTDGKEKPLVLINPVITFSSTEMATDKEGCLSFPDISVKITRPASVSVSAVNEENKPVVIEHAEGLLARALQHEIDHLNGMLLIDKISMLQRQLLKKKLQQIQQGEM